MQYTTYDDARITFHIRSGGIVTGDLVAAGEVTSGDVNAFVILVRDALWNGREAGAIRAVTWKYAGEDGVVRPLVAHEIDGERQGVVIGLTQHDGGDLA